MECDLTVSELFQAYYDCRKAKRNTWNAIKFEENLERNLMDLYYELKDGTYVIGKSICFVVTKPKVREVWAADFRDRIVHHLLYNRYSKKFHNSFIHDSYACIPNKGTLKASLRTERFMRSVSQNYTKESWFLKADIANFFVSIDKTILERLLMKKITNQWWMNLTRQILFHNPKDNVFIKSSHELLSKVPPHKSLLNSPKDFGLPIGNLSSQFFANIYLNELDQYMKHTLNMKYYLRYVDDIVIFSNSPKELNDVYDKMKEFVSLHLSLKFHDKKKELNVIECGVNFVGYIIKPYRKYIRRSTINNMKISFHNKSPEDIIKTINSYFGLLRAVNGYKERLGISRILGRSKFNPTLTKMYTLNRKIISFIPPISLCCH